MFFQQVEHDQEETNSATPRELSEDSNMTRSKKFLQYKNFPRIRAAISARQDALEFFEQKGNSKTANELARVICQAQADFA